MHVFKVIVASIALVLLPFASVAPAYAATSAKGTLVSTVNIQDVKILLQKGNTFTLSFSLTNREGLQSGVKYGVALVSETAKGQFVVDEKVFDEALTLSEHSSVAKRISYTAPSVLDGNYSLFITSRNDSGFTFGVSYVGKVVLSASSKGVVVAPETCAVTTVGGKSATYALNQTALIDASQSLKLSCTATNTADGALVVTPVFETHYQNTFGDIVSLDALKAPISFAKNEKKTISLALPKALVSQNYTTSVSFTDGVNTSNSVTVQYILKGVMGSITNLSFDKDAYKKGDIAKLSLLWNAVSDDNSVKARANPDIAMTLTIQNKKGVACIAPIKQLLARSGPRPTPVVVPILTRCDDPVASVSLATLKGDVLAQKDFAVTTASHKAVNTNTLLFVVLVALIIIGIRVYMFKKRNHAHTDSTPSAPSTPISMLVPFLVLVGIGSLVPCATAKADSYDYYTTNGDRIETIVNIDHTNYSPNSPIVVTASITNHSTTTLYSVDLTASNNGGPAYTIIPQVILPPNNGSTGDVPFMNFTAPGTPQSNPPYEVSFVTGVDEDVPQTPTVSYFSSGQDYDPNLGVPIWGVSVALSSPVAQNESVTVQFNYQVEYQGNPTYLSGAGRLNIALAPGDTGGSAFTGQILPYYQGMTYSTTDTCIADHSAGVTVESIYLCQ